MLILFLVWSVPLPSPLQPPAILPAFLSLLSCSPALLVPSPGVCRPALTPPPLSGPLPPGPLQAEALRAHGHRASGGLRASWGRTRVGACPPSETPDGARGKQGAPQGPATGFGGPLGRAVWELQMAAQSLSTEPGRAWRWGGRPGPSGQLVWGRDSGRRMGRGRTGQCAQAPGGEQRRWLTPGLSGRTGSGQCSRPFPAPGRAPSTLASGPFPAGPGRLGISPALGGNKSRSG